MSSCCGDGVGTVLPMTNIHAGLEGGKLSEATSLGARTALLLGAARLRRGPLHEAHAKGQRSSIVASLFRAIVVPVMALVFLAWHGAGQTAWAQCVQDTVGVPVRLANGQDFAFFGSAEGQSFWANDSLIHSITIWRPANYGAIALGLNLFITKAYKTQPILLDCGVVRVLDSDPPGLPVPMTWTFDPPVSLPATGLYVFWLQVEGCNALDYPILYHTGNDEYAIGSCLYTIRSVIDCVHMPNIKGACPFDVDMCFQVVTCHDSSTPAKRKSWGALKMLYR